MSVSNLVAGLLQLEEGAQLFEAKHHIDRIHRANPDLKPEVIQAIMNADPTGGSYADWITAKLRDGTIVMPEDSGKVRELLSRFHRLKQSPRFTGSKNLYDYKTYGSLARSIEGLESKGQQTRIAAHDGAKTVGRHGNLELIELTTPEASAAVCKGTHWCIKDPRFYEQYRKTANLYVVLKNGQPYVAVHPSSQAMDVYDDPIDEQMAREIAPLFTGIRFSNEAVRTDAVERREAAIAKRLEQMKRLFVDERTKGYTHNGRAYPPMSPENAAQQWELNKPKFERTLPALGNHFGFVNDGLIALAQAVQQLQGRVEQQPAYANQGTQPVWSQAARAARAERRERPHAATW